MPEADRLAAVKGNHIRWHVARGITKPECAQCSATPPPSSIDLLEQMKSRCSITESGCWVWGGTRNKAGYGSVNRGNKAHRVSYALRVGPIPDGFEIDHLCTNPPCINPDHLEAVTRPQHNRRTADRRGAADAQRRAAELRLAGKTLREIADELGFARSSSAANAIGRAVKRNFIDASQLPRQPKLTVEQRQSVAELYGMGVPARELAERFGVDRSYICKLGKGISRSTRAAARVRDLADGGRQ